MSERMTNKVPAKNGILDFSTYMKVCVKICPPRLISLVVEPKMGI